MGYGFELECGHCGWTQSFSPGTGFLSFDCDEDIECIKNGSYGALAQRMIANLDEKAYSTLAENEYFQCPECGGIIYSRVLTVRDESGIPMRLFDGETTCSSCGTRLLNRGSMLHRANLLEYAQRMIERGCLECGGKLEKYYFNWD